MNSAGIPYAFVLIRSVCGITVVTPHSYSTLHTVLSQLPRTSTQVMYKHPHAFKMRSFGSRIPVTHVGQQEGNRAVKVRNIIVPEASSDVSIRRRWRLWRQPSWHCRRHSNTQIHCHISILSFVLSIYIAGTQPGIDLWIYVNTSKGEIT